MDEDFGSGVWGGDETPLPLPLPTQTVQPTLHHDEDTFYSGYSADYSSNSFGALNSNPLALDALSLNNNNSNHFASSGPAFNSVAYDDDDDNLGFANADDPLRNKITFNSPSYEQQYQHQQYQHTSNIGADDGWGSPFASAVPSHIAIKVPLTAGIAVTKTITPTPVQFDPLANVAKDKEEGDEEQSATVKQDEVEQEHIYTFQVSVSDPAKVGNELMGTGHVLYKVSTWTNCPGYLNGLNRFSVLRRYSDFLWLYFKLVERFPGVVVQSVPGKQSIGRFKEDFIESRRVGLEKFLLKTVSHPLLQQDVFLRLFLESPTFTTDKKECFPPTFIKTPGLDTTAATFATTANIGRTVDDEFLDKRRHQIDFVDEMNLKMLLKVFESIVKNRRDYGNASNEFGDALLALSAVEGGKDVGRNLALVGNIQKRIKELHDKQASIDISNMAATVEENLQMIGSVRVAFAGRMKVFTAWQNADIALKRKKESIEKMRGDPKVRADQISVGLNNIPELENQLSIAREELKKVHEVFSKELEKYDAERISDFTASIQAVLKCFLETQKEIIRLWESYYEASGQPRPAIGAKEGGQQD
ncbi:UNVERIFIED_CONTAM: Vacuolar protein sorting-associated protein 5 [Siphonaria sp. JEL0065]|nr:Vacuolar protein sorting-associated protein 5 [Siphonaria sp. JEL0065]